MPIDEILTNLYPGETLWWLETFYPNKIFLVEELKIALEKGAFVKMLILQPNSEVSKEREKEIAENSDYQNYSVLLINFIEQISNMKAKYPNNLDYKTYDSLLGVPCYVITKDAHPIYAYSGMYLNKQLHNFHIFTGKRVKFAMIYMNTLKISGIIPLHPSKLQKFQNKHINIWAWYNSACIYSLINNKDQSILNLKKDIELDSSKKEKAKKIQTTLRNNI